MSDKKHYKHIIFDFDGTIADSTVMIYEMANEILPKYGHPGISDEEIEKMRGMTIPQGFKYLKIPYYRLPQIALNAREYVQKRKNDLKPCQGVIPAIKKLSNSGVEIGILTSNTKVTVDAFLKRNDIKDIFRFVDTGASPFGKATKLRILFKRFQINPDEALYVGDEIRDIEAAKKIPMDVAAVTWGANNKKSLSSYKPTFVLDNADQLLKLNK